jgi:hypothetical protein
MQRDFLQQAVAAGLSFDRAVATLADDRSVLAAARSVFPELRRRGRESSRFSASSVRAQGPQAVSPSAAELPSPAEHVRPTSPKETSWIEALLREIEDLFPEIKRHEKKQRVLEYPAPRASVALEPMRPISLPAENADLPEGWIEAQFPEVAARKARRRGRVTWAEGRRC